MRSDDNTNIFRFQGTSRPREVVFGPSFPLAQPISLFRKGEVGEVGDVKWQLKTLKTKLVAVLATHIVQPSTDFHDFHLSSIGNFWFEVGLAKGSSVAECSVMSSLAEYVYFDFL